MGEEALKYPQVSQDQIDLWLDHPVTKTYLDCLSWKHQDVKDHQANDGAVDSTSADVTFAQTHLTMGQKQGLETAMAYQSLFIHYNMIKGDAA